MPLVFARASFFWNGICEISKVSCRFSFSNEYAIVLAFGPATLPFGLV